MKLPTLITPELQRRHSALARIITVVGGLAIIASAYLPWAFGPGALDNMTYLGGPSTVQLLGAALGVPVALGASMAWIEPWLDSRDGLA